MQEENKAEVSRRSLIRRAGTVAAGVGAAGIASAAIASPAQATDGQPIVQGQTNTGGDSTTTIANNSVSKAAVTLTNASGAPLNLDVAAKPKFTATVGSVFSDEYGALYTVGNKRDTPDGTVTLPNFLGRVSPGYSTSTRFITPERWMVTIPGFTMPNGADGRFFVTPGSANYDSAGRVLPKNNNAIPDLVLEFGDWWFHEYGIIGVQGNLAVMSPVGNGWVSMYDSPTWPGTASLNFQSGQIRDGFTQMGFTAQGNVNFKLSVPAILVFDIFAFITGNGSGRTFQGSGATTSSVKPGPAAIEPDDRPRRRQAR